MTLYKSALPNGSGSTFKSELFGLITIKLPLGTVPGAELKVIQFPTKFPVLSEISKSYDGSTVRFIPTTSEGQPSSS